MRCCRVLCSLDRTTHRSPQTLCDHLFAPRSTLTAAIWESWQVERRVFSSSLFPPPPIGTAVRTLYHSSTAGTCVAPFPPTRTVDSLPSSAAPPRYFPSGNPSRQQVLTPVSPTPVHAPTLLPNLHPINHPSSPRAAAPYRLPPPHSKNVVHRSCRLRGSAQVAGRPCYWRDDQQEVRFGLESSRDGGRQGGSRRGGFGARWRDPGGWWLERLQEAGAGLRGHGSVARSGTSVL